MSDPTQSSTGSGQATDTTWWGWAEKVYDATAQALAAIPKYASTLDPANMPPDATLGQSAYDFSYRLYPLDLGNSGPNCHYVVININVSQFSNFATVNGKPIYTPLNELSKTDALRFNIDSKFTGVNGVTGSTTQLGGTGLPRLTRRIKESIGLFMPDTAVYTQINEYTEFSLADVGQSVLENIAGIIGGPKVRAAGALGQAAGEVVGAALKLSGLPINPRVEVIFKNTPQRRFQFEWLFAPSNEAETLALDQIIRTLRFHAAPEVTPFSFAQAQGIFFIKPSEFDITFYHKGRENLAIPRINTCVLEQIDVDYAPTGRWATFQNGYPVAVKLSLQFRETEILHKLRVLQGF
jgi:hypothetical protein